MRPTSDSLDTGDTPAALIAAPLDQNSMTNSWPLRSFFASSLDHLCRNTVDFPRLLLVITLAFLILSSIALSQSTTRPETGRYIRDIDRNGYGQLIIHNDWTMDTVAVLTDMDAKPLVAAYLRSKDTLNITKIEDGSYGLYFTVGNLWDPKEGRFKSVLGYYRYNTPLVFETTETEEDIEYSVFELDLYQARASNFLPDHFDFPDLRS
jgi:hypothetical protein